ncbi:unnamed protein product [Chrysodeixis includens]|uniref:Fibronectin type-III domain-containing protein n=1 Tax=Chrysodeixis includens TaxID=689277 RepID=A0A9N8PXV0_CHRIL|nr:unnamed protein product [Chrysodeixis includens]
MIKVLIALTLVALCQALQRPTIVQSVTWNDNFIVFEFHWTPVESEIWTDPLVGYKMRVWEVKNAVWETKAKKYTSADGEYDVLMEQQQEEDESMDATKNSELVLLQEIRTPADLPSAAYLNVRRGVTYEIRVSAFTKTHESAYSLPRRLMVHPLPSTPSVGTRSIEIAMD